MTHLALAVVSGMLCGVMGTRYAASLRQSARRLIRWEELLSCLAQLLSERAYSLPEAFTLAAREDTPCDALLRRLSCAMKEQPLRPLVELLDTTGLSGAEADVLRRMLSRVSRGSMEARCLAVRQAAEEMRLLAQSARESAARDAKMWSSLGWTAGACVTLLLL